METEKRTCTCCNGTGRVIQRALYEDDPLFPYGYCIQREKQNAQCANCRGRGYVFRQVRKTEEPKNAVTN